jgi:hypothetical protein
VLTRILRVASPLSGLSHPCKQAIQETMCLECDSSPGEGEVRGVCSGLCRAIYASCREDFFSFEVGLLKACSLGDLVCSKLQDIIAQEADVCPALGIPQDQQLCWDGTPSHQRLGPGRATVRQASRPRPPKAGRGKAPRGRRAVLVLLGWLALLAEIAALSLSLMEESSHLTALSNRQAIREARRRQQQSLR